MLVTVCDPKGTTLGTEDVDPECGDIFCDTCGDCAHCYGDEGCYDGSSDEPGVHWFIRYLKDDAEVAAWRAKQTSSTT